MASLPPENMFELMKQMKQCIMNNPQEARSMLNQNPQLAYALLQAQVVMRSVNVFCATDKKMCNHVNFSCRIVDPEIAVTMLHTTLSATSI